MPNIECRQNDDGTQSHRVKVRLKGHPTVSATFTRLTDARRWAHATEAAIREGRYFPAAEATRHTFAEMIDRYLREVVPLKAKNVSNVKQHLSWWRAELGAHFLSDVTAARIVECRNKLLAGTTRRGTRRAPATVVRYMATLSHVYSIAIRDWQWLEESPMRRVTKPREARGRDRFLSDEERARLLDACRQSTSRFLYPVVVLALSTGMRRGEIMNLRWPDVDLQRGQIMLRETKNGTPRAVPLAGHAQSELARLAAVRRIDTTLVFPGELTPAKGLGVNTVKPVDLTKPWRTAMARAGLKDFRFHDLRHSAASYLAMNGASTIEIAAVLGHKTLQMVKRYSHLANSHTAQVVGAMNAKIFGDANV